MNVLTQPGGRTALSAALAQGQAVQAQQGWGPCACVGPQNGQPLCPCAMRGVIVRDGRYIRPEQDLGPAVTVTIAQGSNRGTFNLL